MAVPEVCVSGETGEPHKTVSFAGFAFIRNIRRKKR